MAPRPGVFETLRSVDGRPLRVDAHLDRLARGAAWAGLVWDRAAVRARLHALAAAPGAHKLNVYVDADGTRVVAGPLDTARLGAAVRCATAGFAPGWPPDVKHADRAGWDTAVAAAAARMGEPVDEVIWRDDAGCLLESTRSNLLAVRDGALWTPPTDGRILPGVTRARALEAAAGLGIAVHEAPLPEHGAWQELYVCSTLKELAPVVRLDGRTAPGAGPVGAALRAAMAAYR